MFYLKRNEIIRNEWEDGGKEKKHTNSMDREEQARHQLRLSSGIVARNTGFQFVDRNRSFHEHQSLQDTNMYLNAMKQVVHKQNQSLGSQQSFLK